MLNLNHYSISTKLSLFFAIPLITIIIFSFTSAQEKYQKLQNANFVISSVNVISVFNELIFGLQKERGLTAGTFINNKDKEEYDKFLILLEAQYKSNDELISNVEVKNKKLQTFFTPSLQKKWLAISSSLSGLSRVRNLKSQNIITEPFEEYSVIIASIINFIESTHTLIDNSELSNLASSFISLQWMKEHAGLERGTLNKALVSGQLSSTELKNIFSDIVGQQAAYKRYKNTANDDYQSLPPPYSFETDNGIDQYRRVFFTNAIQSFTEQSNDLLNSNNDLTAGQWWRTSSQRIDAIHNNSQKIVSGMLSRSEKIAQNARISLFAHSALALSTIIICIILGIKIRSRLVGEISHIAKAMRKNTTTSSSNHFIREQGNDEITDMVRAFNQLIHQRAESEESLQLAAQVFKEAHEGILITDLNSNIVDVNPTFCEITGYSRDEVLGNKPNMLSSGKQSPLFYENLWSTLLTQGFWHGEIWNRRKNGELYPEILTITALKNGNNETTHYVAIFTDISEIKNQQKQLEVLAYYDPLTHLPNRTLFADRFSMAVLQCKRHNSLLAVCFLDLDDFKPVNDKYGHKIGDELLIAVSERITSTLRESDSISRQGGDEFILLLGDVYSQLQVEKLLDRLLFYISQPYKIEGKALQITATAGVTIYPSDDSDIDTLIRHADQSMYKAKLEGKRGYSFYNLEEDQKTIIKHHHLQEITEAISKDQFELYYQPKVNMVTGQVYGAEALIRWNKPGIGIIPPLEFLPLIEGTNLDIDIGEWVINTALKQADTWLRQGLSLEISINISAHHLLSDSFVLQLEDALNRHSSFDPEQLQIEVLESFVLSDVTKIAKIMKKCRRKLGINFALDDFGTGYSTLSHLRNLPADTIKIDQSFVRNMLINNDDYSIIDGVIGLANSFGRHIIAEGVETNDHGLMLIMMGCRDAQGYFIAKPMPSTELSGWIKSYTANPDWLRYSSTSITANDMSLELFRLSYKYWFSEFKQGLLNSNQNIPEWTLKPHTKCQCGEWIKRAKLKNNFDKDWLSNLDKKHQALHKQASELYNYSLIGELADPYTALRQLKTAMDEIEYFIQGIKRKEKAVTVHH